MKIGIKHLDFLFLIILILTIVGLPVAIMAYDHYVWKKQIPPGAKTFTLTGHTKKGWLLGDVRAFDILSLGRAHAYVIKPVIRVDRGDLVVLKLKSSDVVHGFSLKDFEIIITEGIQPGKATLVSFTADKAGTFTFSCNAICGDNHQNMQGTLVVNA